MLLNLFDAIGMGNNLKVLRHLFHNHPVKMLILIVGFLLLCFFYSLTLPNFLYLSLPVNYPINFNEEIVRSEYGEWTTTYYVWRTGCYECLFDAQEVFATLDASLLQNGWKHNSESVGDCLSKVPELAIGQESSYKSFSYIRAIGGGTLNNRFPTICIAMWPSETTLYSIIFQTVNVPRWIEILPD